MKISKSDKIEIRQYLIRHMTYAQLRRLAAGRLVDLTDRLYNKMRQEEFNWVMVRGDEVYEQYVPFIRA